MLLWYRISKGGMMGGEEEKAEVNERKGEQSEDYFSLASILSTQVLGT